jgi:hypothetical protein
MTTEFLWEYNEQYTNFNISGIHTVVLYNLNEMEMYTVCLKSKCTDFPMDELEM